MRAGRLNKLISICKLVETQNEYGEAEKSFTEVSQRWASIEPISANEHYINAKEQTQITHKIEMRYLQGLNEADIAIYNGRKFNIKSVINPKEKNEKLILMVVENDRA